MLTGGPSFDTVKETEWPLNLRVFEDICDTWGPFQIDLFTSRLNIRFLTTSHGSQILRKRFTWIGLTFTVFLHSVWLPHAHKRFYNSTKQWDKFCCSAVIYNSATPSDRQTYHPSSILLLTQPHSGALHPLQKRLRLLACKVCSRVTFWGKLQKLSCTPG